MVAGISLSILSLVHIHSGNEISNKALPVITQIRISSPATPGVVAPYLVPKHGSFMGSLSIPALNRLLPIYQGTEDSQLSKGVGHFETSALPGEANNVVLSGHRDSVFTKFNRLKIGDNLIVATPDGIFTYQIFKFRIVKADDRTVIVPTPTAILTLTTCYPFIYIGSAPDRYIVSANLLNASPK